MSSAGEKHKIELSPELPYKRIGKADKEGKALISTATQEDSSGEQMPVEKSLRGMSDTALCYRSMSQQWRSSEARQRKARGRESVSEYCSAAAACEAMISSSHSSSRQEISNSNDGMICTIGNVCYIIL